MTEARATAAYGTKIKREDSDGDYVEIARLGDISGPSMEREEIDITGHDSEDGWREFIGGLKDPGEIEAEAFFLKNEETHQDAINDFDSRENRNYKIVFPGATDDEEGATAEFQAFVQGMEFEMELEEAVQVSFTWKLSGKVTFDFDGENGNGDGPGNGDGNDDDDEDNGEEDE